MIVVFAARADDASNLLRNRIHPTIDNLNGHILPSAHPLLFALRFCTRRSELLCHVPPNPRPCMLDCIDLWRVTRPPQHINHLRRQIVARYSRFMSWSSVLLYYALDSLLFKLVDPRNDLLQCTFSVSITINSSARAIATIIIHLRRHILLLSSIVTAVDVTF